MQVCTSLQTDNHASTSPLSFLQAGCPSCRPTNSVKALKAISKDKYAKIVTWTKTVLQYYGGTLTFSCCAALNSDRHYETAF